ncbi:MAG: DUF4097 domain-containing protein [Turicibacter sp.]|nr:DUF4097 domain-containing protein [Turicibacter sp.]
MENNQENQGGQEFTNHPSKKSRTRIVSIAILALVAIYTLIFGFGIARGIWDSLRGYSIMTEAIPEHSPIPEDGIRVTQSNLNLSVDVVSSRVEIETHSQPYTLVVYVPHRSNQSELPTYSLDGSHLEIIQRPPSNSRLVNRTGVLTIFIPQDTDDVFDFLNIGTVSGRVSLAGSRNFNLAGIVQISSTSGRISTQDFSTDNIFLNTVSGGVSLNNILAGEINAGSTSGSVTADYINADSIDLRNTSGSVRASNIIAPTVNASSTSGSVRLQNLETDSLVAISTSGRITLEDSTITGPLTAASTSGSINLNNVNANQNSTSLTTTTGRITNN